MCRRFLIFIAVLTLLPTAGAITTYDISIDGNAAIVNATFEVYTSQSGEKVNYWSTSFSLPENAEILELRDSKGEITEYTFDKGKLSLETNKGGLKEKEVIYLLYKLENSVNNEFSPLKKLNLSLPAFENVREDVPDEQTFVSLEVSEQIHSAIPSLGFVSNVGDKDIQFSGDGPIAFTVWFGDGGKLYRHYALFGDGDATQADSGFGIVPSVTGLPLEYSRIPVVVLPDQEYNQRVNEWSAGEFRGGVIFLRGNISLATLLHETTHAFNERALRWQRVEVAWFDEGVAKYVEFLVNIEAGKRQAEIFGKPLKWTEGFMIYTLTSHSSPEELWDYYQEEKKFMESWSTDDASTREFGYTFSELFIRDFVRREGPEALHEVFEGLLKVERDAETPEEYNSILLGLLGSDLRPCYSQKKEEFESCLDSINAMTPQIPENVTIHGVQEKIIIPQIEEPEEEAAHITFLNHISSLFTSLWESIKGLLGI
ncbi:MAG: hypothetical protein ISS93_01380 [Candidatus Aenigmarchaeota archaeon]|nr:hypothetical protein [Candidatus Aenigmarchaeota archaeon]